MSRFVKRNGDLEMTVNHNNSDTDTVIRPTDTQMASTIELLDITHRLEERIKELNCLYSISRLVEDGNSSIIEILQSVAELIPSSWQYPEIACAGIEYRDKAFYSEGFKKTPWSQVESVNVKGKYVGTVEVFYLESRPTCDEGPFLSEERALIHAIAERLGHVIENKESEEKLIHLYEREKALRQKIQLEMENRITYTRSLVHELKTPLTALFATSQLLRDEINEPELHKLATQVVDNAARIDNRINELHDVIKGEIGILKITLKSVNLGALIDEVVDETGALAKQAGIHLRLKKSGNIPLVNADDDRIRQVVTNLLNNALRYAGGGGYVEVKLSPHQDHVIVEVRDYGPGIPESALSRLSSNQEHVKTMNASSGGLGIGLTLCNILIELHGGRFWVKNRKRGTSVCFTLPSITEEKQNRKMESKK